MEYDLCRAHDIQSSIRVDRTEGPECFHHRLLTCFRMVNMVNHNIAVL